MRIKRILLDSGGVLIGLMAVILIIGVTDSYALPLSNIDIGYTGAAYNGWYTEYSFYADELGSYHKAFCVEDVDANDNFTYELIGVPDYLTQAAKIADYFFHSNTTVYTQRDFQIAIWHLLGVVSGDIPSSEPAAQNIFAGIGLGANGGTLSWNDYGIQGPIALAHSPAPGNTGNSQDYLIAAPVPEPAGILLLGIGLLGIAGTVRKIKPAI